MKDKLRFGWCMVALVMLLAAIATANPPTPKGIDGYVYRLDARTEVPDGTNYSVCNLNTTWCIQGVTGNYAHSGRISAAIKGNDGDLLIVRAWNNEHNSSRTIVLNGSMHEVNLLLNASSHPPKLVSSPIEMAAEHSSIIRRSIALTPGSGQMDIIAQAEPLQEMYFTPSPKFPEIIEVGGEVKGGSKSITGFTIINKRTNATGAGIIKRGKINEYYGAVEGKPGDTIVLNISSDELVFTPNETVQEFNITLNTSFDIWKIIAPVFGAVLLVTIVIWRRRE